MAQIADQPTFPVPEARDFAKSHGLAEEAEQIDAMVKNSKEKWAGFQNSQSDARRGCFIELFRQHGLFDQFIKECWPQGVGKDYRRYLNAKADLEIAIGGPVLSFKSYEPSTNRISSPAIEEHPVTEVVTESPPIEGLSVTPTLVDDIDEIKHRNIDVTSTSTVVDARIGQDRFRKDVLKLWGNCCAVTGSITLEAIRASHILPWCDSTDEERLDPSNGLPLIASLDALFDAGLISFDSSGRLLVSPKLTESERKIFGLDAQALRKKPSEKTATYLARHREKYVFGE